MVRASHFEMAGSIRIAWVIRGNTPAAPTHGGLDEPLLRGGADRIWHYPGPRDAWNHAFLRLAAKKEAHTAVVATARALGVHAGRLHRHADWKDRDRSRVDRQSHINVCGMTRKPRLVTLPTQITSLPRFVGVDAIVGRPAA